jgi:hypothetical protein
MRGERTQKPIALRLFMATSDRRSPMTRPRQAPSGDVHRQPTSRSSMLPAAAAADDESLRAAAAACPARCWAVLDVAAVRARRGLCLLALVATTAAARSACDTQQHTMMFGTIQQVAGHSHERCLLPNASRRRTHRKEPRQTAASMPHLWRRAKSESSAKEHSSAAYQTMSATVARV